MLNPRGVFECNSSTSDCKRSELAKGALSVHACDVREWLRRIALSGTRLHRAGHWRLSRNFFQDRIVSKNRWPPRSPDLESPDLFVWGCLKDRVFGYEPRTMEALDDNIRREIANIEDDWT